MVSIKVSFIISKFQLFELYDFVNCSVQEVPSVGNNDHSGIIEGLDILLEPDKGNEVQMICWLIEHEDLRLTENNFGDRDSHSPSSRELLGWPRELLLSETKTN